MEGQMETDCIALTRRELYDNVWRTPVEVLAREWGLSDRGLAKLCDRHGIPVPPRGYWARKKAGKAAVRTPLIEIRNSTPADDRIRVSKHAAVPCQDDGNTPADSFEVLFHQLRLEVGLIKAPMTLARPHPIVARWIADDRTHQKRTASLPYGLTPTSQFASVSAKRRLRLISGLFKALEARGLVPEHDRGCVTDHWVRLDHTRVRFDIRERYRVVRRQPKAAEKAQTWRSDQERIRERVPTGQLALKIQGQTPACLRGAEWVDRHEAKLESRLGEIVAGIIVTAAFVNEVEAERARAEHARWEAQVAARRQAEIDAAELQRKHELMKAAAAWRDAALVRDYIAAVEAALTEQNGEVSRDRLQRWMTWASGIARAMSCDALGALPGGDEPHGTGAASP
jgi:hypothetical protein